MKTLWLMYKTEAKLSLREFSGILFGVIIPIGLIFLLGFVYGDELNEQGVRQIDLAFGAVSVLGVGSAGLMTLPLALSDYRQRKILKRYKVTPISPTTMLASHVLFCFSLSVVSTALIYFVAVFMFGFSLQGNWLQFIATYLLVMISVHAIGMVVTSLSPNSQKAGVFASIIYFPMIFLSGATVPFEIMPQLLQSVANFMPLTHSINLLQGAILGTPLSEMLASLVFVTGVAVVGVGISLRFFRWE